MSESEKTLNQEKSAVLKAIAELSKKIDDMENRFNERLDGLESRFNKRFEAIEQRLDAADIQFEAIRRGITDNSARFDQLEAIALDAKSISLMAEVS